MGYLGLNVSFFDRHKLLPFFFSCVEIQLKDHHIPFLLRKQWPDLLEEFSLCKEEDDRMSGKLQGINQILSSLIEATT